MHFSNFKTTVISGLALCSTPAFSALFPAQIRDSLNLLSAKSKIVQLPAQNLDILSDALGLVGAGPQPLIVDGLDAIKVAATVFGLQMVGSPFVTAGPEANSVFDSFRFFVRSHQELLNILIDRASLLSAVLGRPVASAIQEVEHAIDAVVLGLTVLVPTRGGDIKSEADALKATLDVAASKYGGGAGGGNLPGKMIKRGHGTLAKVDA